MKNTEVAVVTKATAVAKNSEKKNASMLTLQEVHVALQKATEGSNFKVYTDSKFYTGIGVKCNGFSVNVKKTKYNIYCSDEAFSVVSAMKLAGCVYTENGNSSDRTRPNSIECKDTSSLKKMIEAVIKQVAPAAN